MTGPGSCKPLVVCIFGVQICTLPFAETGPAGWRAECWNSFGAAASGTEYALGPGLRCEASSINSSSGRTNSWSVTLNVPPYPYPRHTVRYACSRDAKVVSGIFLPERCCTSFVTIGREQCDASVFLLLFNIKRVKAKQTIRTIECMCVRQSIRIKTLVTNATHNNTQHEITN